MRTIVAAGILVKNTEGKLLLVKKPDTVGPYAGTYILPGGGVHEGESIDEAAQRELYEETGVKATNIKRVMFDDDVTKDWKGDLAHYIMLFYTGEYVSGDLKPTAGDDDHLEVIKWFSPDELTRIPLSPPLQKLLAVLGKWKNKYMFNYGLIVPNKTS